jgi:hypothetical protein
VRNATSFVLCAGIALALNQHAIAQSVVVETWSGRTRDSLDGHTSGSSIKIALKPTTDRINIYSTGGLASIGELSFAGDPPTGTVDVIIGRGLLQTQRTADLPNAAQDWNGADFPFTARLSGAIAGNLTGPINPATIVRLEVHGVVSGPITATAHAGTSIGHLQVGSTTPAGTITAGSLTSGGDIGTIESLSPGASLTGAISALSGRISEVLAAGGIAIPASPGIAAKDGIGVISAGDIDADIIANANSGDGDLSLVVTEGNFSGSVQANDLLGSDELHQGLLIGGAVKGPIVLRHVYGDIEVGSCSTSGQIIITGNLQASILATGNIASVEVGGNITHSVRDNSPVPTIIRSASGSIGRITVQGSISEDDCFPPESCGFYPVRFHACRGFGEIRCAQAARVLISGTDPQRRVPIGAFRCGTLIGGDIICSTFEVFEVLDHMIANLACDHIAEGVTLRVGGSLMGNITTGSALEGQIILNAGDYTPGGDWRAEIRIEAEIPVVLGPLAHHPDAAPFYSRSCSELGHGAVGLVPFNLHQDDCDPPHQPGPGFAPSQYAKVWWPKSHGGQERDTWILEHYGPVFDSLDRYGYPDDPRTHPVIIQGRSIALCLPAPCPGQHGELRVWTDLYDDFDVWVPGGGSRRVYIARRLDASGQAQPISDAYSYRVLLDGAAGITSLRSDMTLLPPEDAPNVGGYPYELNFLCGTFTAVSER